MADVARAAADPIRRARPRARRRTTGGRRGLERARRTARRPRDHRRGVLGPGSRCDGHRCADRDLRPPRRRLAGPERLLPLPPARRRHRQVGRAGWRHGRGHRRTGRCGARTRGRDPDRCRGLGRQPRRRGALSVRPGRTPGSRGGCAGRGRPGSPGRSARGARARTGRRLPGEGQSDAAPVAPASRPVRHPRAGFRGHLPHQRDLVPAGRGLSHRRRRPGPRSAAVRDLLPLAGRSQHPVGRTARFRGGESDRLRPARAARVAAGLAGEHPPTPYRRRT